MILGMTTSAFTFVINADLVAFFKRADQAAAQPAGASPPFVPLVEASPSCWCGLCQKGGTNCSRPLYLLRPEM
jgi:hypothetical protein